MGEKVTRNRIGTRGSWWVLEQGKNEINYVFKTEVTYDYGVWIHLVASDAAMAERMVKELFETAAASCAAVAGSGAGGAVGGAAGSLAPGVGTAVGGAGGAAAGAVVFSVIGKILGMLASWGIGEYLRHFMFNDDGSIDLHMSPTTVGFGAVKPGETYQVVDPNIFLPGVWIPIRKQLERLQPKPKTRMARKESGERVSIKRLESRAVSSPMDDESESGAKSPKARTNAGRPSKRSGVNRDKDVQSYLQIVEDHGGRMILNGRAAELPSLQQIFAGLDEFERGLLKGQLADVAQQVQFRHLPGQYIPEDEGITPIIKITLVADGSSAETEVDWPKKMPKLKI